MQVGELIDLLEPFRGRGDAVISEDQDLYVFNIVGVRWDDRAKVVVMLVDAE